MSDCPLAIARYDRITGAVATLTELAAGPGGAALAAVIASDEVVLARMRAAAEVMRAAGMPAGLAGNCTGSEAELLRRAADWQRFARGPASELHRACARDITRGLLRTWDRRQRPPRGGPRLRRARVRTLGMVRGRCAALRAELQAELQADTAAVRRPAAFCERVGRRAGEIAGEVSDALDCELGAAPAPPPGPVCPDVPIPSTAGLENRLTVLLGAGFGTGSALAVARLLTDIVPDRPVAAAAGGIAVGIALGGPLVRTRRLLCRRAALDRWVSEVTAALRAGLEEQVAARLLAAEDAVNRGVPAGVNLHTGTHSQRPASNVGGRYR